jgi:hypothetical protein
MTGTPATVTMLEQPSATRWVRVKTSVKRLFVGPLEEPRKDVAKTASAQ